MTKQIRKLHQYHWGLWIAFITLLVIGMTNVYSATFAADNINGNFYDHLMKQIKWTVIGSAVAFILYRNDYHRWRKYIKWGTIIAIALLLLVLCIGTVVNGSRRWITIGGFSFQPSELAKLVSIIYAAHWLSLSLEQHRPIEFLYRLHIKSKNWLLKEVGMVPFLPHISLWIPLMMALLVFVQPDAGTATIIVGIPICMAWISGAHVTKVLLPIGILTMVVVAGILYEPYRFTRVMVWIDPWGQAQTAGYQTVQGLIAIGTGHFFGQGLGKGMSKFGFLPEAHTDFAFAVFAQEWGLCGTILLITMFFIVIVLGILTAMHCKNKFGSLLALGLTLYLGGQGFINIAMVSRLIPVVGVPLPFISYGGTALIVNMAAAALLLNISRQNYRLAEKECVVFSKRPVKSLHEETRSQFPLHSKDK